jgi:plasmid maintenance system killer protein
LAHAKPSFVRFSKVDAARQTPHIEVDMPWQIREKKGVRQVIDRAPQAVQRKYRLWLSTVRTYGPHGLTQVPGFVTKALQGPQAGRHESRLNDRYRVIFEVDGQFCLVDVIEITPDHTIRSRK